MTIIETTGKIKYTTSNKVTEPDCHKLDITYWYPTERYAKNSMITSEDFKGKNLYLLIYICAVDCPGTHLALILRLHIECTHNGKLSI